MTWGRELTLDPHWEHEDDEFSEALWGVTHRSAVLQSHFEAALPVFLKRERRDGFWDRSQAEVKTIFEECSRRWLEESLYLSSAFDIVMHTDYQRIIGLGMRAVPLIMAEFRQDAAHWMWALKAITGTDHAEGAQTIEEARDRWLAWFDQHPVDA